MFCLKILFIALFINLHIFVPIEVRDRQDVSFLHITKIGQFGLLRKARPNVPAHFHTGIDIMRPRQNYNSEPVMPIAKGVVISKRTDGPYANVIIEHALDGHKFWSLYEHVSGIRVKVNDRVEPHKPIARFMNKDELNRYGWQFNHFHLEILKVKPIAIKSNKAMPERLYNSYSLSCLSLEDLNKYYYNPILFLKGN